MQSNYFYNISKLTVPCCQLDFLNKFIYFIN